MAPAVIVQLNFERQQQLQRGPRCSTGWESGLTFLRAFSDTLSTPSESDWLIMWANFSVSGSTSCLGSASGKCNLEKQIYQFFWFLCN